VLTMLTLKRFGRSCYFYTPQDQSTERLVGTLADNQFAFAYKSYPPSFVTALLA
jgi:hypothetical protein